MSVEVHRSAKSRHLVLRLPAGAIVPEAISDVLRDEQVACGWLRASGILQDVELRAFDPHLAASAPVRRIAGSIHAVTLEGAIGLTDGKPTTSLRALLARETDRGLEALAGEIVRARVLAVEALVTALDDLALERGADPTVGLWLLGTPRSTDRRGAPPQASWSTAAEASAQAPETAARARAAASAPGSPAPMPQRILARPGPDVDTPVPEAGDLVDHFAFGRCEVLRSDGDRLHLRVHKDGRVREIALEMLRVTRLATDDTAPGPRFKLERRM
jgi:predicted DNA-binding protein with PD1-like motif